MKKLARSTVIKVFEKLGFKFNSYVGNKDYYSYYFQGSAVNQNMDLHIPEDSFYGLNLLDARWVKDGGVHIDSYYTWPRNLQELQSIIDRIKHTYSELCGTNFNS